MATRTYMLAAANDNKSQVLLVYDDVTMDVSQVQFTNPEGYWRFTLTAPPNHEFPKILGPGDSGSQAVPKGFKWSVDKAIPGNISYSDSWSLTTPQT